MTEYELIDAIIGINGAMHNWLTTYFTTLSAYLITAYFVGLNLDKFQSLVITVCFVTFSGLCILGVYGGGLQFVELASEVVKLNPSRHFQVTLAVVRTMVFLLLFGIFVAMKFMWDVRHPKEE